MARIDEAIEVRVRPDVAFTRLTHYEEYPKFMEGMKQVERSGEDRLRFISENENGPLEWEADILAEVPAERLAWASVERPEIGTMIVLTALDGGLTRIEIATDVSGEGDADSTRARLRRDLERLRDLLEGDGDSLRSDDRSASQPVEDSNTDRRHTGVAPDDVPEATGLDAIDEDLASGDHEAPFAEDPANRP